MEHFKKSPLNISPIMNSFSGKTLKTEHKRITSGEILDLAVFDFDQDTYSTMTWILDLQLTKLHTVTKILQRKLK